MRTLAALSTLALGLAACNGTLVGNGSWPKGMPSVPPVSVVPTDIGELSGPATASAGQGITLHVLAYAGANGCESLKEIKATLDPASRSVTVEATRQVVSQEACPELYPGFQSGTASFTPMATGTYRVTAPRFRPDPARQYLQAPAATLDIRVK